MKIIVLMGSPRKKDSFALVEGIGKKIQAREETSLEYVYLRNENIEDCRGCDQCFRKGEGFCPIRDGLNDICKRIEEADGVIFACPVYAHQVTAPMKKFIDRLSWYFHRPVLFGKFSMIVVTTAATGLHGVIDYLKLVVKGWGLSLVGCIGVNSSWYFDGMKDFSPDYTAKINKKIDKAVSSIMLARTGKQKASPDLFSLAMFLAMREKAKHLECDRVFWESHGWFKARYYHDINLSLPKLAVYKALQYVAIPLMYRKPKSAGLRADY